MRDFTMRLHQTNPLINKLFYHDRVSNHILRYYQIFFSNQFFYSTY